MKAIYIVEDDEGIRELTHFLLEAEGYEVMSFSTIESFKKRFAIHAPDLVLLDIRLPDGDGREVCREIRLLDTGDLPIVLMSANTFPSKTDAANDFIAKPFDIEDFLKRIENQLVY